MKRVSHNKFPMSRTATIIERRCLNERERPIRRKTFTPSRRSHTFTPPTLRPTEQSTRYNLSFIAASLRPDLARIIAECYLTNGDWNLTKAHILATNALQCRSASSAIRMERELRQRLATLTREQLVLIAQATAEDRTAIAWLSACKQIPFAFDFAAEILRDKLASQDPVLRHSDYETYFETQRVAHAELNDLAPSTKEKVRQILFRMLSEAGLVVPGEALGSVQRPVLSPAVFHAITADAPELLAGFLVPDSEIPGR